MSAASPLLSVSRLAAGFIGVYYGAFRHSQLQGYVQQREKNWVEGYKKEQESLNASSHSGSNPAGSVHGHGH